MEKEFTFDRTVRLCITIAVIVALYLVTKKLSGVLLPFVVAWFIAYLLHPIVNFFQYKCRFKNRLLSVVVTIIVVLAVLSAVITALATPVANEVNRMTTLVATYISNWHSDNFLPEAWQEALKDWLSKIDFASIFTLDTITALIEKISPYIGGILGGSVSFVSSLFVVFVCILYVIFILLDYSDISAGFMTAILPKYRQLIGGIKDDLEQGMNKYFRGQALIAMTVGVLFAVGFSIMRLPLAIVIGLFIGLLNMVPYLQTIGIPICMILGVLQSAETGTAYWIILVEIAAVFLVVQSIQDLLLNPLIMGNVIGMKPAVMLLSLSIFGSLFGVAGMIIALPVTTVMISYYKRFVLHEMDDKSSVAADTTAVAQEKVDSATT